MKNTETTRRELNMEEMENVNGGILPIFLALIMGAKTVIGFAAKQANKKYRGKRHGPKYKKGLTYK